MYPVIITAILGGVLGASGAYLYNKMLPDECCNGGMDSNPRADATSTLRPQIYIFMMDGCHYCEMIKPTIREIENQSSAEVLKFTYFRDKQNPTIEELLDEYDIDRFPTIIVRKDKDNYTRYDINSFSEPRDEADRFAEWLTNYVHSEM